MLLEYADKRGNNNSAHVVCICTNILWAIILRKYTKFRTIFNNKIWEYLHICYNISIYIYTYIYNISYIIFL